MTNNSDDKNYLVSETLSLLTLSLLHGVGYKVIKNIAQAGLELKQVLKADSSAEFINYLVQAGCKTPNILQKEIGENWIEKRQEFWSKSNKLYQSMLKDNIQVIHYKQDNFPQSLRKIKDPPYWLFVQGNLEVLNYPSIAVVGTRKPSEDGIFLAQYIGASLGYFNAVTVSGLALGIDQIIHQKSIRMGIPTVAIIGTGIFLNYPYGSEKLRQKICENGGAIVTEYLPYQNYSAENFVHRNRLQAGLADILIPVEWKAKSGTAHTVRFAKESHKTIVGLRLPDWSDEHTELLMALEMGGKIFTIPGEESEFISAVRNNTKKKDIVVLPKQQDNINNLEVFNRDRNYFKQLSLFE